MTPPDADEAARAVSPETAWLNTCGAKGTGHCVDGVPNMVMAKVSSG